MSNKVKLISLTQPFNHEATGLLEDLIAYCARVSNPENQNNKQTAPRLLKFLIKHKHWSPFEMVDMCVEIKTSRAIAAQILRHRSFSFQEFSQRYSAATDIEPIELRSKAETNRQSSSDVIDVPVLKNVVQHSIDTAMMTYDKLIIAVSIECCTTFFSTGSSITSELLCLLVSALDLNSIGSISVAAL